MGTNYSHVSWGPWPKCPSAMPMVVI